MATLLNARPYGRFIGIQSNLRRKELKRTNQDSNFLGRSFSNNVNVTALIQFRRESRPQILKDEFSSRTASSILKTAAPVLLDLSKKTSFFFSALKSTSHFLS